MARGLRPLRKGPFWDHLEEEAPRVIRDAVDALLGVDLGENDYIVNVVNGRSWKILGETTPPSVPARDARRRRTARSTGADPRRLPQTDHPRSHSLGP